MIDCNYDSVVVTPRQRQLWDMALRRRSLSDYDRKHDDSLVADADIGFSRLVSGEMDAFVWHRAGLEYRAAAQWGCGWRSTKLLTMEDVGMLSFGISLPPAEQQGRMRRLLNGALLRLERENFFTAVHDK